jgi:hypothetical protein
VMIRTYRTMKKRRMQRNTEGGLFTKPLKLLADYSQPFQRQSRFNRFNGS